MTKRRTKSAPFKTPVEPDVEALVSRFNPDPALNVLKFRAVSDATAADIRKLAAEGLRSWAWTTAYMVTREESGLLSTAVARQSLGQALDEAHHFSKLLLSLPFELHQAIDEIHSRTESPSLFSTFGFNVAEGRSKVSTGHGSFLPRLSREILAFIGAGLELLTEMPPSRGRGRAEKIAPILSIANLSHDYELLTGKKATRWNHSQASKRAGQPGSNFWKFTSAAWQELFGNTNGLISAFARWSQSKPTPYSEEHLQALFDAWRKKPRKK